MNHELVVLGVNDDAIGLVGIHEDRVQVTNGIKLTHLVAVVHHVGMQAPVAIALGAKPIVAQSIKVGRIERLGEEDPALVLTACLSGHSCDIDTIIVTGHCNTVAMAVAGRPADVVHVAHNVNRARVQVIGTHACRQPIGSTGDAGSTRLMQSAAVVGHIQLGIVIIQIGAPVIGGGNSEITRQVIRYDSHRGTAVGIGFILDGDLSRIKHQHRIGDNALANDGHLGQELKGRAIIIG